MPTAPAQPTGPLPAWLVVLFPIFFLLLWFGVVGLLSAVGGWRALARRYAAVPAAREGEVHYLCTASLGPRLLPVNYRSCLTIEVQDQGLRLSVLAPFRFMHPPLFIPWTAVRDCREAGTVFRHTAVTLDDPEARIRIWGRTGRAVREQWTRSRPGVASPRSAR